MVSRSSRDEGGPPPSVSVKEEGTPTATPVAVVEDCTPEGRDVSDASEFRTPLAQVVKKQRTEVTSTAFAEQPAPSPLSAKQLQVRVRATVGGPLVL